MVTLPAPLVPAEVDLRDFPFMPLDVRRLRDSRLVATRTPEEVVAAVLLWSASWHQQPAASLPDDDSELSQLAGYGRAIKEFRRVKDGALHGLVRCSDGRLYHPVVAEKAAEAWNSRLESEWRRSCDRTRKENKERKERQEKELPIPARPALLSMHHSNGIPSWEYVDSTGIPSERLRKSSLKGEGYGQGIQIRTGIVTPSVEKPVAALPLPAWLNAETWTAYVQIRKAPARKPESLKAALAKLEKFRADGHDANEIVATSLANGWQGLFKPDPKRGAKPSVADANRIAGEEAQRRFEEEQRAAR